MDSQKVKERALILDGLLTSYAKSDDDAASLLASLSPLLKKAEAGKISHDLEWNEIPGAYFFNEGSLRKYRDLESAFADFRIELTGGESAALRRLKDNMSSK